MDVIRSLPIFSSLSKSEIDFIEERLERQDIPKGHKLFSQGDDGGSVKFIVEGKVKISLMSKEGRELLITYFSEGDFFGELSVLTGQPRSADAFCVEDCTLYSMSSKLFYDCFQFPEFPRLMMCALAKRLVISSEKFSDLVLYDLYRNVAYALHGLAEEVTEEGRVKYIIYDRPTHQEIAAMVGSSREVITRTLKHLQRNKCIEINRKQIIIHHLPT